MATPTVADSVAPPARTPAAVPRSKPQDRKKDRRRERRDAERHRDGDLGQGIGIEALEELRAGAVADGEEEQQEERLLHVVRQHGARLSDQHARQQAAGNGADGHAEDGDLADGVADAEREEEGELSDAL